MSGPRRIFKRIYAALPFKQQLFTALRAVVRVPPNIHRHLHFKGVITVRTTAGEHFRMRHHGYVIENELFWRGLDGWEKVSLELWTRLCRRSNTILDIGANTGVYALLAQAVRPMATVVAVEPVARVFHKLQENIALNGGRTLAVNAAISNTTGTAVLYDLVSSEHVLSVSLDPAWAEHGSEWTPGGEWRPVEVPCLTVTDLLVQLGIPSADLIKIDVETHEPAVLEGFLEILRRDRPTLMVELLTDEVAGRVAAMTDGLGYVYYNIDDVTWPPQRVPKLTRSGHYNFLVCRPEVAEAIGI